MFSKKIQDTLLTSDEADKLFPNITATNVPDQSFLATLRALLLRRLPRDETVHLACRVLQLDAVNVSDAVILQYINLFITEKSDYAKPNKHSIFILAVSNPEAGEKMLGIIQSHIGFGKKHLINYTRCDDLRVFYARKMKALFYMDESKTTTLIFLDILGMKHFHVLQMMIPRYLPLVFANSPLADAETALLKSMGNKSSDEYETWITEFTKILDLRSELIRNELTGFETVFERMRADELRKEIASFQADYKHHVAMMRSAFHEMQDRKYSLAGLECAIREDSSESELLEYFICNKHLTLLQVKDTAVSFIVHGYADVYDLDAFERYVGNHRGYMYSSMNSAVTRTQLEKLYRAIFSEYRYKLRLCAAFSADVVNGLKALRNHTFTKESLTFLPNPHIQQFGCVGGYAGQFQEYIQRHDYVGAIDQAVVSTRNLNFYDSAVMTSFAKTLSTTALECLERADKTLVSPLAAIKEMKEEA